MIRYMKVKCFVLAVWAALFAISCTQQPTFDTRVEKILYEINDPESDYVVVASHRGDWRNYPENSIPAIESVIRMGVDIMELDVKMTKDSVLILMHDKTIDRMTNGKGRVCDITYDSLMTFNMRRAHNIVTDTLKVPTLREALICCKDRILVNVDHAYPYYEQIVKLTEELGVAGQVLMKSKSSIDKVNEDTQKYGSRMLYMPVVDVNKPKGKKLFAEYLEKGVVPMAFELCWQYPGEEIDECVKLVHKMGSKIWVNTIWASLCGGLGNDDDAALAAKNPADVYGQYIDMGVSMIQTDRPEMLLNYLRSIGRHD